MNLVGHPFPLFCLNDQQGKVWSNDDLKNRWTILYAYPKDMTSGCTLEAKDFVKHLLHFESLNAQVLGVSPDDEKSHVTFCEKERITFSLLSDTGKKLLQGLGAWREKSMAGKKFMGVERSTWIIDPKGEVVQEWRNVKVPDHVAGVLKVLEQLQ